MPFLPQDATHLGVTAWVALIKWWVKRVSCSLLPSPIKPLKAVEQKAREGDCRDVKLIMVLGIHQCTVGSKYLQVCVSVKNAHTRAHAHTHTHRCVCTQAQTNTLTAIYKVTHAGKQVCVSVCMVHTNHDLYSSAGVTPASRLRSSPRIGLLQSFLSTERCASSVLMEYLQWIWTFS